jgi:hypothetical protein
LTICVGELTRSFCDPQFQIVTSGAERDFRILMLGDVDDRALDGWSVIPIDDGRELSEPDYRAVFPYGSQLAAI